MDQSSQEFAIVNYYGGSDSTEPSFNYPRYVRYGSVHAPRDFGKLQNFFLDIEGLVGAESGTQTLFFRFELTERSRVGLRRIFLNRYTDQYITIDLANSDNDIIPLGLDGFAGFGDVSSQTIVQTISTEIGYVICGYWATGYAEYDCVTIEDSQQILSFETKPTDPFNSIYGDYLPPGAYRFTVSSSQWPKLPYRIQLAVIGEPELVGETTSRLEPSMRLSAGFLEGEATMSTELSGQTTVFFDLGGEATMQAPLQAAIERQSPFG